MDVVSTWWLGKEGQIDKRPERKKGASLPDICRKTNEQEQDGT